MTWTFRAVLALLRGAVVSWLAFSFSAVAGFSLVLCLGHFDCGQWKLEGGRVHQTLLGAIQLLYVKAIYSSKITVLDIFWCPGGV